MNSAGRKIQNVYLTLILLSTLAASLIWGINTLFLLDAGLSNTEAFAANAFFTAGMVLFEVPTGIVADTRGRRLSFLLGAITLAVTTILYFWLWTIAAPFWAWATSSMLIGLGFTFFSGATEAWLVDALKSVNFTGPLESVFAKGQIVMGIAMLCGSVLGGFLAQLGNLGIPYVVRAALLIATFVVAAVYMKDMGYTPIKSKHALRSMQKILTESIDMGIRKQNVRWLMLAAPFTSGVGIFAFYAMQPYLLELWGDSEAYIIAGLAAAIVAGAQILGGLSVKFIRKLFASRLSLLLTVATISAILLALIGLSNNFWVAIFLLTLWALLFAASVPVRQAYLNDIIPSKQRATILSFDSLMGSSGGVVIQPVLGKSADVWSYSTSYLFGAIISAASIPFLALAKHQHSKADSSN